MGIGPSATELVTRGTCVRSQSSHASDPQLRRGELGGGGQISGRAPYPCEQSPPSADLIALAGGDDGVTEASALLVLAQLELEPEEALEDLPRQAAALPATVHGGAQPRQRGQD